MPHRRPASKPDVSGVVRNACLRWSGIALDVETHRAWLNDRTGSSEPSPAAEELALIHACVQGDAAALRYFEADYIQSVVERGARQGFPVNPAMIRQAVLTSFDGSTSLGTWMHMAHGVWPRIRSTSRSPLLDNSEGEGVVSVTFVEGWVWSVAIAVRGQVVFEFGNACGTCGTLFRNVADPRDRITDAAAAQLLGSLDSVPDTGVLRRLGRILEPGSYRVDLVEAEVCLVEPGSADDLFVHEVVDMFERGEEVNDQGPYYRLVPKWVVAQHAALAAIVAPLHATASLDPERVRYWRRQFELGVRPTALALSVVDVQERQVAGPEPSILHLLTFFLLDGHHRLMAAADLRLPVRLLVYSRAERHQDGPLDAALAAFECVDRRLPADS